jgi:hypothetical protein
MFSQPLPTKLRQYVVSYPSDAPRISQLRSTHMKSYILYNVSSAADASTELDRHLSRSGDGTWVLWDEGGDAIAYFIVGSGDRERPDAPPEHGAIIQADISGRHFYDGAIVLSALRKVQDAVGGVIRDEGLQLVILSKSGIATQASRPNISTHLKSRVAGTSKSSSS